MKNLFIVGTPLQLLNAIEAAKHFSLSNNILLIVHRSLNANKEQMEYVKTFFAWDEIIEIPYSKHSSLFKYIAIIKQLKQNIYSHIFISKLEIVPKLAIANLKKNMVFLLDDGLLTIDIYNKQIKRSKYNKYDFKELRFLAFGLKIKVRDTIHLFTIFKLKPFKNIEVVQNNFDYLLSLFPKSNSDNDDCIYFLGHPSNPKLVSNATYMQNINKLLHVFNKKIIYIPHRAETAQDMELLGQITNPLFFINNINMPVELYFLQNGIYPHHIISYYSTALVTLSGIFKDAIATYIYLPNGETIDKDLIGIYKLYTDEGYQKLNLEDVQI